MANLAKYIVQLEAQTAKYRRELDTANRRLNRFQRNQRRQLRLITRAWSRLAPAIGAAFGGAGLVIGIRQSLELADNLSKLTDRLGGTVEAFSELRFVAERSGLEFRTLTMGLQRMQRRVAEAAVDLGEARGALKELGLDARELTSLAIDKQFEIIAEALSQVRSDADKTRLAMKLFDSEGVALLQTMNRGAAGIEELRQRARELGVTLSTEQAAAAVEARDSITELTASWAALTQHLTLKAAPTLKNIVDELRRISGAETQAEQIDRWTEQLNRAYENLNREGFVLGRGLFQQQLDEAVENLQRLGRETDKLRDSLPELQEITVNNAGLEARRAGVEKYITSIADLNRNYEQFLANYRLEQRRDRAGSIFETASLDLELYIERQDAATEALSKFAKASDELDEFLASGGLEAKQAANAARELGLTFSSAFEDAIVQGNGLREVLQGLAQDLLRIVVRRAFTEKIAGFFSGLVGRRAGGPVTAGVPVVVGESGPEVFVPSGAGKIVPNTKLGGMTFAPVTNINVRGNIDERRLVPILEANNRRVKGEFLDELNRGKYD